jgi:nitrite reductase (NADH) small subunit
MADPASGSDLVTVNLGSVEKVPLGQGFCFLVGGREIAVFRQRDGRLFATQNRCPHKQGPLSDGLVGAGKVICPLHAKKFDLATGAGPEPQHCLQVYPVREVGGEILLSLDRGVQGEACVPAA